MTRTTIGFLIALATGAGLPAPARAQGMPPAACTEIAALPATLANPGNYCLARNFTVQATSGASITILANDVTVDCRDFTITNTATNNAGTAVGILANGRYNLLIENCRLMGGFSVGIFVNMNVSAPTSSFYNRIENNYVAGPYRVGIAAFGSAIAVRGNEIYDVGGQLDSPAIGIQLSGSSASNYRFQVVEDNQIVGTVSPTSNGFGIYSGNSIGSVIRDNLIVGSAGAEPNFRGTGVRIGSGVGNVVRDNHIAGAGRSNEIGIQTPENNRCFGNLLEVSLSPTLGCDASLGNP